MTWSTGFKIPANQQMSDDLVTATIDEKYEKDVAAACDAVEVLDTFDPSQERSVTMSGYRSGTTNSFTVGVTGKETPPAGTGG